MQKILVVGAGVTGCFTAALLERKGLPVTLLARGERADRLEREGLHLRDGLSGEKTHCSLPVIRSVEEAECDLALLPSLTPETWCFTLSSVFRVALFPVVFDLGALADRVREAKWGDRFWSVTGQNNVMLPDQLREDSPWWQDD